jgi:hypothetical protein
MQQILSALALQDGQETAALQSLKMEQVFMVIPLLELVAVILESIL